MENRRAGGDAGTTDIDDTGAMQKEKPTFQGIPNWGTPASIAAASAITAFGVAEASCIKGGILQCSRLSAPANQAQSWRDCDVAFIDRSSAVWDFRRDRSLPAGVSSAESQTQEKGEAMQKMMMALAAAATLAVSAVAVPAPAHAQRGLAAGIAGGLIGGAIIGGALAGPRYYGPGYGYYGGPAYVADPGYGDCFWQRQRFWDGYGWRIRRIRVCS